MKTVAILSAAFLILNSFVDAQGISINATAAAPNASAILDLNTGNAGNKGFLPPQVALTATNAAGPVASPAAGLMVYNTATAGTSPTNVIPGYYYWNGASWVYFVDNAKVAVPIPAFAKSGLTGFDYYAPGYDAGLGVTHITNAAGLASINYINAPNGDKNFFITSNGHFSKAYGWLNSDAGGAFDYIDVWIYLYTPAANSSVNIPGVLIGSTTVTVATAGKNYSWEITANTTLTKGQFIMVFYSPEFATGGNFLYASGTIECTFIPQ